MKFLALALLALPLLATPARACNESQIRKALEDGLRKELAGNDLLLHKLVSYHQDGASTYEVEYEYTGDDGAGSYMADGMGRFGIDEHCMAFPDPMNARNMPRKRH